MGGNQRADYQATGQHYQSVHVHRTVHHTAHCWTLVEINGFQTWVGDPLWVLKHPTAQAEGGGHHS